MLSDKEIQELFRQEAMERVESIESTLLQFDENEGAEEAMNDLFRGLHTLKGSGNMAGFLTLGTYVHELETNLVAFKTGKQKPGAQFVTEFLSICDVLKEMINAPPDQAYPGSAVLAQFHGSEQAPSPPPQTKANKPEPPAQALVLQERSIYLYLEPAPALFQEGISVAALFSSLETLGELKRSILVDQLAPLPHLDPESSWLAWSLELRTLATLKDVEDIFSFLPQGSKLEISEKPLPAKSRKPRESNALLTAKPKDATTNSTAAPPSNHVPSAPVTKLQGAIRGLLCKVGEVPVLVPSEGIRACRPPLNRIQRPLGICEIDGFQETVIDLPTLFQSSTSEERVLVLMEQRGQKFALAVETFEDFMDGEILSSGIPLVSSEGTDGFILDPEGNPVLILDMDWFVKILGQESIK